MIVGITGGTGFIGSYVVRLLVQKGYDVIVFTRNPSKQKPKQQVSYALFDADNNKCDTNALATIDCIIHLAGAGVSDKRWTETRKKEIVDSRVKGTEFLVRQLRAHAPNCETLVAASAIGYYGPDRSGLIPFQESAPVYNDFLGQTCAKWEAASTEATSFLRTVILRFGVVMGKESGAFPKFTAAMPFGILPVMGNGKQIISWIQVVDLADMVVWVLEQNNLQGIFNAVAPYPVSNRELMKTIAKVNDGFKVRIPVPAILLKTMLGQMSEEILKSCTVSADKIQQAGFTFKTPTIEAAIKSILKE